MHQDEINKLARLSLDLNTNLCILKNAVINNDENDLSISDLIVFLRRIYQISDEIMDIASNL